MNILKMALIGVGVAYSIQYLTKKRADGTSVMDDLLNKGTELMDKGKEYAVQTISDVQHGIAERKDPSS